MDEHANRQWSNRVVITALILITISSAHLIEDYLYGVHTTLGLNNVGGQVAAAVWYLLLAWLLVLAARGARRGYAGFAALGIFLTVADIVYHADELLFDWPYRAGVLSKLLSLGVIASAVALTLISYRAWRATE